VATATAPAATAVAGAAAAAAEQQQHHHHHHQQQDDDDIIVNHIVCNWGWGSWFGVGVQVGVQVQACACLQHAQPSDDNNVVGVFIFGKGARMWGVLLVLCGEWRRRGGVLTRGGLPLLLGDGQCWPNTVFVDYYLHLDTATDLVTQNLRYIL